MEANREEGNNVHRLTSLVELCDTM